MANSLYVRRLLGLFVLLGALALGVVVFNYFSRNAQQRQQIPNPAASVDLALKSLHFTESSADRTKWELYAASGEYSKSADLSLLKDLRFILFRAGNEGRVTVTAKQGEYAHATKNVTLAGNVQAKGTDGVSFETPRISYDSARRIFRTDERVKMTSDRMSVEGVGMEFKLDGQTALIQSRVEATIYPGKSVK